MLRLRMFLAGCDENKGSAEYSNEVRDHGRSTKSGIRPEAAGGHRAPHQIATTLAARVSVLEYETVLKTGKFVVIAHSTAEEAARAREIIRRTNPEALAEHPLPATTTVASVAKA